MPVLNKINSIMKEITIIKKEGKIAFGATKYNFIEDAEVTQAIREKMVEAGLVMYPTEAKSTVIEFGGKFLTVTEQKFRIQDIEDNTYIEVMTAGQGADTADKGSGKSMTNARKYALLQTFMLTGEDPDDTPSDSYRSNNQQPAKQHTQPAPQAPAPGGTGPADMVVTFGKMKGKTLGQILSEDRSYIEWLAGREGQFQQAAIQLLG